MSDTRYAIWLSSRLTPGSKSVDRVLGAFDSDYERIYNADRALLEELLSSENGTRDTELIDSLCDKDLSEAEKILDYCERQNIGIVTLDSKLYPLCLKRISGKPLILYFKGRFPDFDNNACIATVGTRKYTDYGRRNAYTISRDLAKGGAIVVSGMARGIDSICHRGALDAGGFTVAVLGCGIDVVYPPENALLMDEIAYKGLVVTEYAPGTEPFGFHFPARNRIISGLCSGTLVIEGDESSGAMITARYAQSQGRDIFSLPGNVGEKGSRGPNSLIMNGARMVTSALDMLCEYEYIYPHSIRIEAISQRKPFGISLGHKKMQADSTLFGEGDSVRYYKANTEPFDNSKDKKDKKDKKEKKPRRTKEKKTVGAQDSIAAAIAEQEQAIATEKQSNHAPSLTDDERRVLQLIPEGKSITTDEIARGGLPISTVLTSLTTLEIKGVISALPGGLYTRK